jgi:23S rRNA pseudouridine1911/1915/1917 synthase
MEIAKTLRLVVDKANLRLDRYVCQSRKEFTRSYIQKLIDEGYITVNGQVAKPSLKPKVGDVIVINLPPPSPAPSLIPQSIPLALAYEDDDLLVIDKPAGITVYPAPGHPSHTVINALLAHCPQISAIDSSLRPGIVHRLDKDTSGLMIVAKNKAAQLNLSAQFSSRHVLKRYLVLVKGRPSPEEGVIEAPIGRHPRDRKRMAVIPQGREARTLYRVVKYLSGYTLVEATPQTGRTHQIRVHFSSRGYPVAGDPVYGVRLPYLDRQFIHACLLGFKLPSTGEYVEFRSELPTELRQVLEHLSLGEGV